MKKGKILTVNEEREKDREKYQSKYIENEEESLNRIAKERNKE
jgi:hypothetical protein